MNFLTDLSCKVLALHEPYHLKIDDAKILFFMIKGGHADSIGRVFLMFCLKKQSTRIEHGGHFGLNTNARERTTSRLRILR